MITMSRCKACGAEIVWVKMKTGKNMPCDAHKIPYRNTFPKGDLILVTPDGKLARGELDLNSDTYGYESHFATCPAAKKFRR